VIAEIVAGSSGSGNAVLVAGSDFKVPLGLLPRASACR
jgi:hypothetical protein